MIQYDQCPDKRRDSGRRHRAEIRVMHLQAGKHQKWGGLGLCWGDKHGTDSCLFCTDFATLPTPPPPAPSKALHSSLVEKSTLEKKYPVGKHSLDKDWV